MRCPTDDGFMKTKYSYALVTHMTSSIALTFRTKKAEIVIRSVIEGRGPAELTIAEVTLSGRHSYENFGIARSELIKVVLREIARQARVLDMPGFLPRSWEEVSEDGEPPNTKQKTVINLPSSGSVVVPYTPNHNYGLKVNTDSASPAIIQYYQAMGESNPASRYAEMFKIIEYFSGEKLSRSAEQTVRDGLIEGRWWIPPGMESIMDQILQRHGHTSTDPAGYFWGLRSLCSHMRPDYGMRPFDEGRLGELFEGMFLLEAVVRHTLERHSETREI